MMRHILGGHFNQTESLRIKADFCSCRRSGHLPKVMNAYSEVIRGRTKKLSTEYYALKRSFLSQLPSGPRIKGLAGTEPHDKTPQLLGGFCPSRDESVPICQRFLIGAFYSQFRAASCANDRFGDDELHLISDLSGC